MHNRARVLVVVLVLTLLCQGCVGHRMYRPESIVAAPAYDLAFIELDAQGELWSPAQLTRALARIQHANATDEGAILLVFIHGWQHDAAEGDTNVEGFRSWLASVSAMEAMRAPANPRRVVGIYVGWRGRSSLLKALSVFTFFARFAAAKRVASPATTQALYELMLTARANPRNTTVVAGHSFGGLILESALAQALIGSLGATFGSDRPEVDFPADLILLINPASQAIVAKQLVEIFERHHLKFIRENEGRRYEVPLVVSVTSNADTPTRVFFPLGMQLRGFSKRFHGYGPELCGRGEQASYFRRTAGHQQVLHSHRLSAEMLGDDAAPGPLREVRLEYGPETRQEVFTASGARLRYRIRANPLSWNDTPYWIMSVPPEVLPDHSRIFGRETLELGAMLLQMSGALEDRRARLVRDDRVKPVLLAAVPDGGVRFVDRSRRIYAIDPTTSEAVFVSCVPQSLDEGQDVVGIAVAEQGTWIVGSLSANTAPEARSRMGIARFSPAGDGSWAEKVEELPRDSFYEAAAFDFERQLVFLARRGAPTLEVADLVRRDISPVPLVELGAAVPQISLLAYDAGARRLFASDGRATVLAIDLEAAPPRIQVAASGLDRPSALAFDRERRRLYVATSGDGGLWKLECATECSAPARFASVAALRRPRTLAVDARGLVWAGDLENEIIVGFSPAGRLVQQVERLPF